MTASLRLPQALQTLGARPAVKCFDLHWRQMLNIDPPSFDNRFATLRVLRALTIGASH